MGDFAPEELVKLASAAKLTIPEQDLEQLTNRFNALIEALDVLDDYDVDELLPLPVLPHPHELPPNRWEAQDQQTGLASTVTTETDVPLAYKPITELAHLLTEKRLSSAELTDAYLERIERLDGVLRSYITVTPDIARREAAEADARLSQGQGRGPLDGIPVAYKDEYWTKDVLTTNGSKMLSDFVPDADAAVVERLRAEGAVMLGKLNMTEFATPLTLEFTYGQPTNPWNVEHDAGGSSTGSGSAAAAALCAAALGEDTGGSIRRPAAFNSCVGLRPSWGRVSTYGLIPAVWYQDTAGPLARTVADCALLMNAIAGYDARDIWSANLPVPDYTRVLDGDVKGMRIGVIREFQEARHLHLELKSGVEDAVRRFETMGAVVEEVSLPLLTEAGLFNLAMGSGRVALQWTFLKERAKDYDMANRIYTMLPGLLPAGLYQRALQVRSKLRAQVLDACDRYDALISPCQPGPPPRIEDTKKQAQTKEQVLAEMRRFSFGAPSTYTGIPAISVPCGLTEAGLPMGLQIMAKRFDEESVFRAAYAYEQDTPWHTMLPPYGSDSG